MKSFTERYPIGSRGDLHVMPILQSPSIPDDVGPRAWAGLAVVAAASFLVSLDAMVLYIAFREIGREFPSVGTAELSWILSASSIVVAGGMISAGRIADRLGRRRVFLAGTAIFAAASALCAVAPTAGGLIAARALQGLGVAALTPASLALILHAFPRHRVPHAIALWGAAAALAAVLGPTVGGLLVETSGWRAVFALDVVLGVTVVAAGRRLLDESREPAGVRMPDPVGVLAIVLALGLVALAVTQSGAWGWTSFRTVGALLAGFALLGAFVVRCRSVESPVLPLELFAERAFRWANAGQLVFWTGFTLMFFGNVQFLSRVWDYSPAQTGLALAPGPLLVFLLSARFGRLAARIGQRPILIAGGVVYAAAAASLLARVDATPRYLEVWLPSLVLSSVGVAMLSAQLTSAALWRLPAERFATGAAVNGSLRALGQTLGVAVFAAVVGQGAPGQLLAGHRTAWWLVFAAGLALTLASLRLPGIAPAPRPTLVHDATRQQLAH